MYLFAASIRRFILSRLAWILSSGSIESTLGPVSSSSPLELMFNRNLLYFSQFSDSLLCCYAGTTITKKMAIIKLPVKINMQLPFPVQPTWRLVSWVYSCRQKSTNIDTILHFPISLQVLTYPLLCGDITYHMLYPFIVK